MATPRERLEELRAIESRQATAQRSIQQPVQPPIQQVIEPAVQDVAETPRQRLESLRSLDKGAGQQVVRPETGVVDIFTGSERIAATPELGELPEFGTTEEGDTFKIAVGLLSTFDPKAQTDIILENIPGATFEKTPDGSTIIEVPTDDGGTRRSVLNRPGFSPQDLTTATAQFLSFLPTARLASLAKGLAAKFGIGAGGAAVTEQALQETGVALGRKERDPLATGIAAATGGLSEVAVPAIQAIRGARQIKRADIAGEEIGQVARSVDEAREATEQTGIPLFQAQQTIIPAQLEKQSFIAQLPAGTKSALDGLRAQNKAAGDAIDTFLGQIAPDTSVVTGAERFRTAAQAAIDKAKLIRKEKASPLYNQALESGADVDLSPVKEFIKSELIDTPESGEIFKSLTKADSLMSGKGDAKPTLKLLHNAKLEIDQMLNKFGETSLGNTTKAKLVEAKNLLLGQMEEASPGYKSARETFEEASPDVTKIRESIVGKIADLDDTQLKQVSTKIFDPAQTNPAVVAQAKKAIKDVDPDAWSQLIRVELERRLGSIKSTSDGLTTENIPGQLFRALFPNEKSTKVLMNALDNEGKANLAFLKTALGRARLGRPGGSQTASREEIKKELKGGAAKSIRDFLRAPISTLVSTGDNAAFDKRTRVMAKALFDPTWKAEMKAIRKLRPNAPESARAMTQLLNDIETSDKE